MSTQINQTIGVVILNYNSADVCRTCIQDIKKQCDIELEIIVVDNCSKIADRQQLEKYCNDEEYTLIINESNSGYNAGNNVGLRYAAKKGYKYVFIANPDMEFDDIYCMSKLVLQIQTDDEVVACGCDIITREGTHQNPVSYENKVNIFTFDFISNIFTKKKDLHKPGWIEDYNLSHYCKKLNGCFLLLKTSFLKEINFFDERTFLYGEESILARQIERSGKKMYYLADAQAVHNHIVSKEGSSSFRFKHWQKSRLIYIKYYSDFNLLRRWVAMLQVIILFTLLRIKHMLK